MKHKIILDCDPGHDDAIAILLAAHHPDIDLLAITTVAGNQSLDKTTLNALKVCSLANIRNVPVAKGVDRPLVRPARHAANIHGESGMDGPNIPEPDIEPAPQHGVDLLIDLLMNSDGDITIVPTGPLTNIATAIRREPAILPRIKAISLMGGAIGVGAAILGPITIGRGSKIGAMALVLESVPPNSVVASKPAELLVKGGETLEKHQELTQGWDGKEPWEMDYQI